MITAKDLLNLLYRTFTLSYNSNYQYKAKITGYTDRIWSSRLLDMAGHSGFGKVANFSAPGFIRSIKAQVAIYQVAEYY